LEAGGTFFSYLYGQSGMDFFSWMWDVGPQHPMWNLGGIRQDGATLLRHVLFCGVRRKSLQ
jgi:hypothetical protein